MPTAFLYCHLMQHEVTSMKIIRKKQVIELTGLSGRTIDRKERAGQFPARIILGANSVGWDQLSIENWMTELKHGWVGQGAAKNKDCHE